MAIVINRVKRLLQQSSSILSRHQPVCRRVESSGSLLPSITTVTVPRSREKSTDAAAVSRPPTLRRALMYVPAADERKTQKAAGLKVDTIIFDLEDGVAVNQKVCQSLPSDLGLGR